MRNPGRIFAAVILAMISIAGVDSAAWAAAPAGSISGTVWEADGMTPVYTSAHVFAYDYSFGTLVASVYSSAYDGSYTIPGLASGHYRVMARSNGYFSEYYNNVPNSGSATAVAVTDPNNTPNINFTLAQCGSISGTVTSDNGTPIYAGHVMVFDSVTHAMVDETWMRLGHYDYRVGKDLLSGSYHVSAEADGYFSEYYNDVTDIGSATPVAVTSPSDTPNINFTLSGISAVSAAPTGETTAAISWTTGRPATSQVEYGLTMGYGSSTTLDSNLVTSHSVNLTGLTPGATYHYRVLSADAADNPVFSAGYIFTTLDFTNPVIGDIGAVDITGSSATITWTTDEVATSQVEYGLDTNYGTTTDLDPTLVTSHSVSLQGLTAQITYHYAVRSTDASGNPASSVDCTFVTVDDIGPDISAVSASNISTTAATITWTTDEAATSQVEFGRTASRGWMTTLDSNLATSHSVTLHGLTPQATYHYAVRSADALGNPAASADYTFTTLDATAPRISRVSATNVVATGATITWNTDEEASSQVEWGLTTSYGSSTTLDSNLVTSHSVNLSGLGSHKTYHYRVKSSDAAGNPAVSKDFTFTTTDVIAPSSPVVTDDGGSTTSLTELHASWTSSDTDSGIVEYQYAIGTTTGGTNVVDWTSVGTDTSVTKTGLSLSAGTTYYFSVKAKDTAGLWSNVGTSDGIVAQAGEEPSEGGGWMPVWTWVLIVLAGAAALGGLGYFGFTKMGKQ